MLFRAARRAHRSSSLRSPAADRPHSIDPGSRSLRLTPRLLARLSPVRRFCECHSPPDCVRCASNRGLFQSTSNFRHRSFRGVSKDKRGPNRLWGLKTPIGLAACGTRETTRNKHDSPRSATQLRCDPGSKFPRELGNHSQKSFLILHAQSKDMGQWNRTTLKQLSIPPSANGESLFDICDSILNDN